MTAQMSDHFRYQDVDYSIIVSRPRRLFSPTIFGLEPVMLHTACYRGFVVHYALNNRQLMVEKFLVGLTEKDGEQSVPKVGPPINGISPTTESQKPSHQNWYNDFNYPFKYTGGILLGNDFMRDLYVHGGTHPVWKYKTVIELSFNDGILLQAFDRSQQIADICRNFFKSDNRLESDLDTLIDQACEHPYYAFFDDSEELDDEPSSDDYEPID
ncbi:MAG: hypothetical protein AAFN42_21000 [Cyanobacteria bacterium J06554_1]